MEIEESSLYREVARIIGDTAKPVLYTWRAEIYANGSTVPVIPLKILNIDTIQDYEENFADVMFVDIEISAGDFTVDVYPFQANLDILLYREPLQEASDVKDPDGARQVERYTAVLDDPGNLIMESNSSMAPDKEALNLSNTFTIRFQLINKAVEQLRVITVGGTFRNTTVEDVLKYVLTRESANIKVDLKRMPQGVDMVESPNKKKRDHVIVPQGTKLTDLPDYLQNNMGVYSSGMGAYYHQDHWFIYPCYDATRFKDSNKTLTIINIPRNRFPGAERTYLEVGNAVTILATGETKFRDNSELMQNNLGNGVRFADANNFMPGLATTSEDNKATARRSDNNNEFVATPRANGMNNVQMARQAVTANPYVQFSDLSKRQGGVFSLIWENSNPRLVFPGMPVKIMYLDNGIIKELYGAMLKAHHSVQLPGQSITAVRHVSNSVLVVFCAVKTKDQQ